MACWENTAIDDLESMDVLFGGNKYVQTFQQRHPDSSIAENADFQ